MHACIYPILNIYNSMQGESEGVSKALALTAGIKPKNSRVIFFWDFCHRPHQIVWTVMLPVSTEHMWYLKWTNSDELSYFLEPPNLKLDLLGFKWSHGRYPMAGTGAAISSVTAVIRLRSTEPRCIFWIQFRSSVLPQGRQQILYKEEGLMWTWSIMPHQWLKW